MTMALRWVVHLLSTDCPCRRDLWFKRLIGVDHVICLHADRQDYTLWSYPKCYIEACPIKASALVED